MTIPKHLTRGAELIVLPRLEYEYLQHRLAELTDALAKIRRGEMEYRAGKTRVTKSLSDLRR
jgi:hypothetical protein